MRQLYSKFVLKSIMIWINFKIYQETFGDRAVKLAKICRGVSKKTGIKIIPVVSALDLRQIKKEVGGEVWIQHLDLFFEGPHTGWISPLAAILAGANGALLNHSEHKISPGKIRQILAYLKKDQWRDHWVEELIQAGIIKKTEIRNWKLEIGNFPLMVCVKTKGQVERWLKKLRPRPEFVAYEPPELIGGKVSVAEAKPEAVSRIVKLLPDYQIIIGAGVKNADDVKKALKLGAKGVLVSSAVVRAKDPEKKLLELAEGFKLVNNEK